MAKWGHRGGLRTLLLAEAMMMVGAGAAIAAPNSSSTATNSPATGVSELIVTATRRNENVEQVPFTVTAFGQADLQARGALTIDQAIQFAPGVNFTANGTNSGAYTIRGVNTGTFIAGTQSPVALYIDDLNVLDPFFPAITPNLRLFDVDRVEVLEGPQGTLFGSGSLGGAIRIITNKPDTTRFEAETEETLTDVDGGGLGYDVNAMINVPLVRDKLAARITGYYQRSPGWVDNTVRGESDVNYGNASGARVELKWMPTQDLSLIGSALFENSRPHDSPFSIYNSNQYQWNGLVPVTNYDNTRIYSLTGVYDFHLATLTSITTYADRFENVQTDFSFIVAELFGLNEPVPINDFGPSRTFSQEVRLASPDTSRFRWLIGGIYIDNHRGVDEPIDVPGSGALIGAASDLVSISDETIKIREEALFGELSYDILPRLTATVGVRVADDRLLKHQVIGGTFNPPSENSEDVTEKPVTPKFNITYHLAPTSLIYVQAAKGYRIGQPNPVPDDPISHEPIPPASSPDSLWNYEIGEKSTFLDGRLLVNASAYYIDWSNIQLNEITVPSGINFIGNAGIAHIKGFELEIQARPTREWSFGGSLSVNDAHLVSVNPTVSATVGDQLPGSAPVTGVVYGQFTYPLRGDASAFLRVDARWIGKEYANLMNATSLTYGDYSTVNIRGGFNWGRYGASVFVTNAFNNDGKTAAFIEIGSQVAVRQQPVTFGITLDAKY